MFIGSLLRHTLPHLGEKKFRLEGYSVITSKSQITIDDYSSIGRNCYLHTNGGLEVGKNVQISRSVVIYTTNHNFRSDDMIPYGLDDIPGSVVIEDNAWVGMRAKILPGVRIGEGAVIGLGATITRDVPKCAIVVGINQIVGYRDKQQYETLCESEAYFGKQT